MSYIRANVHIYIYIYISLRDGRVQATISQRLVKKDLRESAVDLSPQQSWGPRALCGTAFGNALTGIRAASVDRSAVFAAGGTAVRFARVFSEVPPGQVFWYENASGLVEVAVNRGSAAEKLGLGVGDDVSISVQ